MSASTEDAARALFEQRLVAAGDSVDLEALCAEHPDLAEGGPETGHPSGVVVPARPYRVGTALVGEQFADGVAEHVLLVGEGESEGHVGPLTASAGRARARR